MLDNKQQRAFTSFRAVDVKAGTPAPYIDVVLVIDAINADLFNATMEREGIRNFLQSNGGKLAQPVFAGPAFPTTQPKSAASPLPMETPLPLSSPRCNRPAYHQPVAGHLRGRGAFPDVDEGAQFAGRL